MPAPTAAEVEPSGKRVVFWLFACLWVVTAVVLLWFALLAPPDSRRRVYVALVVNLMLPLIAWQAFRWIHARRQSGSTDQP